MMTGVRPTCVAISRSRSGHSRCDAKVPRRSEPDDTVEGDLAGPPGKLFEHIRVSGGSEPPGAVRHAKARRRSSARRTMKKVPSGVGVDG